MMFQHFLIDDSGAVTVDWTVLTAAIVGLGITSATAVRMGTSDLANDINGSLSSAAVAALGELGATAGTIAGMFQNYQFLFAPETVQNSWQRTFSNFSDSNLQTFYGNYASAASRFADLGNTHVASIYMDLTAVVHNELTERSAEVPDTEVDLAGIYERLS